MWYASIGSAFRMGWLVAFIWIRRVGISSFYRGRIDELTGCMHGALSER